MEYLKSVLRLEFEEPARPWLELREILRVAGGEGQAEIQAAPIVIDRPSERTRVIIHIRAVAFEQDVPTSIESSVRSAIEVMTGLNEASEFPSISLLRHSAVFIEPYALPFHELVAFLKGRWLQPSDAVDAATDIALVFDKLDETGKVHVQFGPMDAEQLRKEFLRWPPDDLPETFVFLSTAYEATDKVKFSSDLLKNFLATAVKTEAAEAEIILGKLKESGG